MRYLLLHNARFREEYISDFIIEEINRLDSKAEIYRTFWAEEENNIGDIVHFNPDVILTFPFTISDLIEEISAIKCICGCKVCTFTTEGYVELSEIHDSYIGFYDYPSDLIDHYMFFGPAYEEEFMKWQVECGRATLTTPHESVGYPMYEFDKLTSHAYLQNSVGSIFDGQGTYKKTILVLSGFNEANKDYNDVIRSNDAYDANAYDAEAQIEGRLRLIEETRTYREAYYNMLLELADKNRECLFIIKLHPMEIDSYDRNVGYDFNEFERLENVKLIKRNIPLGALLPRTDCMIHYGSTACAEAYILGVKTIFINGFLFDGIGSYASFDASDTEGLSNCINSDYVVASNPDNDAFCYDFFNYKKGNEYHPSELIANILLSEACRRQDGYNSYVDYGYYRRLYAAYGLMLIKRIALLKWKEAVRYYRCRRVIRHLRTFGK